MSYFTRSYSFRADSGTFVTHVFQQETYVTIVFMLIVIAWNQRVLNMDVYKIRAHT